MKDINMILTKTHVKYNIKKLYEETCLYEAV